MTNKNKDKNVSAIAQNCTLIRLETKTWRGVKSDPELRDTLAKDYEAQSSSFNVQKYLVGSEHKKQWKSLVKPLKYPGMTPTKGIHRNIDRLRPCHRPRE